MSDISSVLPALQVSIFLIFLIFDKRTGSPHAGKENVKSNKTEHIFQSEKKNSDKEVRMQSDHKIKSEDLFFDSPADYDESGCPKVPFVFSGMTGKQDPWFTFLQFAH